jgi:hypothetical protein
MRKLAYVAFAIFEAAAFAQPRPHVPSRLLVGFRQGVPDPQVEAVVKGLGFIKGSHSPHYDAEPGRRPLYQKLVGSGAMMPGYACDNDAGIYFEDNTVKRVVAARAGSKCYYVSVVGGALSEKVLEPEAIS